MHAGQPCELPGAHVEGSPVNAGTTWGLPAGTTRWLRRRRTACTSIHAVTHSGPPLQSLNPNPGFTPLAARTRSASALWCEHTSCAACWPL